MKKINLRNIVGKLPPTKEIIETVDAHWEDGWADEMYDFFIQVHEHITISPYHPV